MPAGRPRIYNDPEDFDAACEAYFAECEQKQTKPLLSGLAFYLGFADRSSLYEYRDRPEYSYSVKRAVMRVEMGYEAALQTNNVTGSIFALKNLGWKDKTEQEVNVTMPTFNIIKPPKE